MDGREGVGHRRLSVGRAGTPSLTRLSEVRRVWVGRDRLDSYERPFRKEECDFRTDCSNVVRFFRAAGGAVIGMRKLFEFIVDPCVDDAKAEEMLAERLAVLACSLNSIGINE